MSSRLEPYQKALQQNGWCIVPDVLADPASARAVLDDAVRATRARGQATFMPQLDPNEQNIRVFNLLELAPLFRELIMDATALSLVESLIGCEFLISNFTANIALPGSKSMQMHADQALVIPEPWLAPWAINIIWCLSDVTAENGGTRYLPGSHNITKLEELPQEAEAAMIPFEASAGSVIAMDGRMWHTSGANVTKDQQRALLFGYYSADFIRPQTNWNAALSADTLSTVSPELHQRLGLSASANINQGAHLFSAVSTGQ